MKRFALLALSLLLAGCASTDTGDERDPSVGAGIPEDATGRLKEIKERGYLTVATEPYWIPNEFIDPTKTGDEQYVGSDIELARYIADKMGVELRIVPLEFTAVLSSVPEGKYDLAISALAYTPLRAEAMEMSQGYYFSTDNAGYGIMVPEELAGVIEDADDLADYTVITQSGSIQELMVNEQVPAYKEFKRVGSMTDAYLAVQEGKADAAIVARSSAQLYIDSNPSCGLAVLDFRFVLGPEYDGTRIGIKKGETDLLDFVNTCIDELNETGQYSEWYDYYTEYGRQLGIEN